MAPRGQMAEIPLDSIGDFPECWETSTLEKACALVTDGTHDSPKVSTQGYPLVTGKCITGGRIRIDKAYLISEADHKGVIARSKPEYGDILFANIGNSIGELARVETDAEFSIKNVALFKPGERLESLYLKYYLKSPFVQSFIKGNTFGSAQPFVGLGSLRAFPIPLPPLPEQKAIAHILGSLDDKIELNRRMNETLEGMAQALFKSWFVDFDPVIDNALEAGNPIPAPFAARAETRSKALANGTANREAAKTFPATFQETEELGWIPEGWEVTTLGKHINFQTGPAFKSKDFSNSGTRLARGDNVKEGRFQWGDKSRYWETIDEPLEKYLLDKGDVLLGMDGSKVGKNRARVRASDLPCLLVQRVARLSPKNTICSGFIFLVVNGEWFRDYVEVVKTGSAIPHISGGQIKGYPLVLPQEENSPVFGAFGELATSLFDRTDAAVADSLVLSKLRDTLLPKLISGEIRVPQAEQMIKDEL